MDSSPIVGYSDIRREADGKLRGTCHRQDGSSERTTVRVVVERQIARDGRVIADGEVASSDAGTVAVGDGAAL